MLDMTSLYIKCLQFDDKLFLNKRMLCLFPISFPILIPIRFSAGKFEIRSKYIILNLCVISMISVIYIQLVYEPLFITNEMDIINLQRNNRYKNDFIL